MNDFIFNVQPQVQKILFGQPWDTFLPPLVGSFGGVLVAFLLNNVIIYNYQKFLGEYLIKAEMGSVEHDLRVGGKPEPIEVVYGADYIRENRLFGENRTQIILWYEEFQKYNFELEELKEQRLRSIEELERLHQYQIDGLEGLEVDSKKEELIHEQLISLGATIETKRNSMANQIEAMLRSGWLKRIPDDMNNSGLSNTKFIWYLLKQDALPEPTKNRQIWVAALDKFLGAGVRYD